MATAGNAHIGLRTAPLPLGAMLLAASMGAWAQQPGAPATPAAASSPAEARSLPSVTVKEKAEGKDSIKATTTRIGKGEQDLRDLPQSVTVTTEKLIDDRNLDTLRDVLRLTSGISFLAAEGGEEDIRLRGFSLATTGDLFIDGMRDPAFYDRDTFNLDRVEVLRGSASMLFGRGSTGGAVNQVSKIPRAVNQHEISLSAGTHQYWRLTGDFNWHTGPDQGLRVNVMGTRADNNGAGTRIDKSGAAVAYRWGIGHRHEFMVQAFHLDNRNGVNYGLPWLLPFAGAPSDRLGLIPGLRPSAYYGLASDRNAGEANWLAFTHTHRLDNGEWRTVVRKARFERDLRASTIRFAAATQQPGGLAANAGTLSPATVLTRGTALKLHDVDTLHAQSDVSVKFDAWGLRHELQAGVDLAREEVTRKAQVTVAQGGTVPVKPTTTLGRVDDGASIDESSRRFRDGNGFRAQAIGAYVQDLMQVAPHWKLLAGLRFDHMKGRYEIYAVPTNALTPVTTTAYEQKIAEWSHRLGLLYQPDAATTYHVSWGTSFNTSGDTYSYNALSANTPPESSENIEIGGRIEGEGRAWALRWALFRSTKKNERNTDPDTAATRLLLSGKRHAMGLELDVAGRIARGWEVFASYMWIPRARVDAAAATATLAGNRVGDRPGLTPRHSGTVWTTYQLDGHWRIGGGVNFRSRQAPADTTPPPWFVPGYATVDLMAEYTVSDRYTIKASVSNLFDRYYGDALYRGHYIPGPGRLAQVTLTARF